ncbi:MAG: MFS transporter [Calditrichae bacterium]|nr:MFS transporter [Calditrichia bacterium]
MKSKAEVPLFPILSVNFIGTLGFGIILPFLIYLVTSYGGNALIYGILGATYSAFQLLGAPLLGKWSDIFGRRKILLLSQLGTLISWLIFFWAMHMPADGLTQINSAILGSFTLTMPLIVLFMARALDGLTGGNVSVANAYLADITPESERSKNFGKLAISSNLGYVIGPALAGLLGATAWGEKLPVLAAILISFIASAIIFFRLPEYSPRTIIDIPGKTNVRKIVGQEQKECFKLECKEEISFSFAMKMKDIRLLLIINFLVFLGFNFFYIAFPVYAVDALKWDIALTGTFFSFLSIFMVLIQGPVLSFMSKKFSDNFLTMSGSVVLASSFLFFLSHSTWVIYIGALFLAIGNGIMWPSVLALISKTSPQKFQGAIQGYSSSLGSAASIIGLLCGGLIYNQLGAYIFVLAAVIIITIFIIMILFRNNLQ